MADKAVQTHTFPLPIKGAHVSDIFYEDVKLYKDQRVVDRVRACD